MAVGQAGPTRRSCRCRLVPCPPPTCPLRYQSDHHPPTRAQTDHWVLVGAGAPDTLLWGGHASGLAKGVHRAVARGAPPAQLDLIVCTWAGQGECERPACMRDSHGVFFCEWRVGSLPADPDLNACRTATMPFLPCHPGTPCTHGSVTDAHSGALPKLLQRYPEALVRGWGAGAAGGGQRLGCWSAQRPLCWPSAGLASRLSPPLLHIARWRHTRMPAPTCLPMPASRRRAAGRAAPKGMRGAVKVRQSFLHTASCDSMSAQQR